MEHLNRTVKMMIGDYGSNFTPKAIVHAGKCASPVHNICQQFDQVSSVAQPSGMHARASYTKDLERLVNTLHSSDILHAHNGRFHKEFKHLIDNLSFSHGFHNNLNVLNYKLYMYENPV